MKLLGISGGPDSMLLLNKYKNKKIFVAHVNYNARKDSKIDENIVVDFCKDHNIPYKVLSLKSKPKNNFQAWAREQRFNFFQKLYKKYNCKQLLLAHHKDDFLETALMQSDAKRQPRHYGIKVRSYIDGMNIYRPFIKYYWKNDILKICERTNLKYATDSSNAKPIYTRNKKRIELKGLSHQDKKQQLNWYKLVNKILAKKYRKVDYLYKKWEKTNFSLEFIRAMKFREELIFEFIINNTKQINVSAKKIDSIVKFLMADKEAKEYKLADGIFLSKKNKKIKIKYN